MAWTMKCMLCPENAEPWVNLVAIQEHVMQEHGYTVEDIRKNTKTQDEDGNYTYIFPDGKAWLYAVRGGTRVGGV